LSPSHEETEAQKIARLLGGYMWKQGWRSSLHLSLIMLIPWSVDWPKASHYRCILTHEATGVQEWFSMYNNSEKIY
jgi:hypothetical protein